MSEIEKCVLCGSAPGAKWGNSYVQMICKQCWASGPMKSLTGSAEDSWNILMRWASKGISESRERDELREQVERLTAALETEKAVAVTLLKSAPHQSVEPNEMIRQCGTCEWYSKKGYTEGQCHRYPKNSWKAQDNFCGEWKARTK